MRRFLQVLAWTALLIALIALLALPKTVSCATACVVKANPWRVALFWGGIALFIVLLASSGFSPKPSKGEQRSETPSTDG